MQTFAEYLSEIAMSPQGERNYEKYKSHGMFKPSGRLGGTRLSGMLSDDDKTLRLGYAVYVVFMKYVKGPNDPASRLLARRGDSVDIVRVKATAVEAERLREIAQEILQVSANPGERRTAEVLLGRGNEI